MDRDKNVLAQWFRNFAKNEGEGSSPLYAYLANRIAADDDLLALCMHAKSGQPVPNLLFAAVHYLLKSDSNHSLRDYYASLVPTPKDTKDSFSSFKDFCVQYQLEIRRLLENKRVQTNEIRRCAYLYPSFCYIYSITKKPLALIEIGTSAGLQLLWDKYSYSYNNKADRYGAPHSYVHITSEMKGTGMSVLYKESPPVAWRVGVDLYVSEVNNPENVKWLEALIWPEHKHRLDLFRKAVQQMQASSVELIEGDGVELLSEIANQAPHNASLCIFHTHVANQMPPEVKQQLLTSIQKVGENRDVFHLYNNIWDANLHLDYVIHGKEHKHIIGQTDGHGRWFSWN